VGVLTGHSGRRFRHPHKLLALAASAAAGLVIFAGADSATATATSTALCKSEKVICPYSEAYVRKDPFPSQAISGSSKNFVLEAEKGKVTCPSASISGTADGVNAEPEQLTIGLSVSNPIKKCTAEISGKKTECTTASSGSLPGSLSYTSSGDGLAELDGDPGILFVCGTAVNCTYSANPLTLDVTGAATATIQASSEAVSASGSVCLGEGTLSATFEISNPKPMFVAEKIRPEAVFCKIVESPCSTGEMVPLQSAVSGEAEAESKFIFEYSGVKKEPACKVSTFAGTTKQEFGVMRIALTSQQFKECGGGLCTISAGSSSAMWPTATGEGNGTTNWIGTVFTITGCPEAMKCIYGPNTAPLNEIEFTTTGGSPMKVQRSALAMVKKTGSDAACSTNATWEGVAGTGGLIKYKILSPSPFFVTS
jgi:hypothetical protein